MYLYFALLNETFPISILLISRWNLFHELSSQRSHQLLDEKCIYPWTTFDQVNESFLIAPYDPNIDCDNEELYSNCLSFFLRQYIDFYKICNETMYILFNYGWKEHDDSSTWIWLFLAYCLRSWIARANLFKCSPIG